MDNRTLTRRAFLAATTATASQLAFAQRPNTARVVPRKLSPNDVMNVACIGVGGKGRQDSLSFRNENIVALCDVDEVRASHVYDLYPNVKKFDDYRRMLDKVKDIDAVTVSTPDHTHAPAAYRAMKLGKHVYVQKPLTHTIAEARLLTQTAREMGVATQMGNQGHSGRGAREVCEMIWSGAIGDVREAHVWTNRPTWPQGIATPLSEEPVREGLDWDLWIGAAPERPFNNGYCPGKWRGWYDFGAGALGDMACHIMDPVFWALKLSEAESYSVEITAVDGRNDETFPNSEVLKYSFPARGDMPAVDVYWYDGGNLPPWPEGVPTDQEVGDGAWDDRTNGSYFVGDDGYLTCGEYGGRPRLLPDERMADYVMPEETIPRVRASNHYMDFIAACKGEGPACSNFDYSGPFTEMTLMGVVALQAGEKIAWNAKEGKVSSPASANALLTKEYRKGFELPV